MNATSLLPHRKSAMLQHKEKKVGVKARARIFIPYRYPRRKFIIDRSRRV